MVTDKIKEQSLIISYRKHQDVPKALERDRLYNTTLKNCTNLREEDLHDDYRIVVSCISPARFDDLLEDVLLFCNKYDFLRGCATINDIRNSTTSAYGDIVNVDFYLKKVCD